jgi:hypothetical protein
MGVDTFLLDRRTAKLRIGGDVHSIGTLRRFLESIRILGVFVPRRPERPRSNCR